ncbi:MAG TPA: cobalamin-binding protein [Clostridiaceae bacterium]|nr:cobalamin-binding protein [Clostridiaceae bacterium]
MEILQTISEMLQKGKAKDVKALVQEALDQGIAAEKVLNDGLLAGMSVIGEKFKNNEIFVPDVLIAARAMKMGSQVLKPYLSDEGVKAQGKVVIGTVQGDLHDIGKNLVSMMMEGKGLEVIDLGVDTPPERFVSTAIENDADIIACSALLTTTMNNIKAVVDAVRDAGVRDKVTIMVGGAPLTEAFAKSIGADIYTPDAASAADAALSAVQKG